MHRDNRKNVREGTKAAMSETVRNRKGHSTVGHKIGIATGTILCVFLIPILIINVTLIIRSYTNPDKVPSIGSTFPLIVLTDSMFPEIESGDLVICHTADPEDIAVGDVIAFFDPAGNGSSIVMHRVIEVTGQGDSLAWKTKGDANNVEDRMPVPADKLVGIYSRSFAGLGNVVLFMQSTEGLIVCVICPILLLVGWDLLRRRKYEKSKQADTDALMQELEELRAQKKKQAEEDHQTPAP